MLVLTRKRNQMIQIGEDVFVKVIKTSGKTVKIGIEAPQHIRVLRAELCDESRQARKGDKLDLDEDDDCGPACSDQFPHPCVA